MRVTRVTVLACAAGLIGCVSPESTRVRGGGPGADPQNRPAEVKMHEGSRPYWETPLLIDDAYPDLEPAQHAREVSRQ